MHTQSQFAFAKTEAISGIIKKKNKPNKAMVPTPVNVTVPAYAGPAPFTSVAHLGR
jgi:hypothetical protein